MNRFAIRLLMLAMFSVALIAAPVAVYAAPDSDPPPPPSSAKGKKKKSSEVKPGIEDAAFANGYRAAYALVQAGDYKAAFAAFKALEADDTPDVANYLGYTARKLGDYEASKYWYERALASDPNHVRTWQYYGMWHVEQGNMLKAQDFLERIRLICGGTACKEYQDLKGGIEGTVVY